MHFNSVPVWTMPGKGKILNKGANPQGPGAYNSKGNTKFKEPEYSFGKDHRRQLLVENSTKDIGPGAYNYSHSMDTHYGKIGKSKRKGIGNEDGAPGPGSYNDNKYDGDFQFINY